MKISSKSKVFLFMLLFATIALPLLSIPAASAHFPAWNIPRYAYVTAAPNPVGPGQPVAIVIWTDIPPPSAAARTGDRWTGYKVDVTKPDGTTVNVLSNGVSDPVGSSYALYTPDVPGTYTITFSFPQQVAQLAGYTGINGTNSQYINDTYSAASATTKLVVQATPIQYFVEAQHPVSYWTRPINENNQLWSDIGSAWLGQRQFGATYDKFNPDGWAPSTAHVSMTYPLSWGGIVGTSHAKVPDIGFYSGTQYNLKFTNPIIMYGNVYFSIPVNPAISGNGIACVDLRTGQTKWTRADINSVSFGQLYDGETPNQHGVSGMYLWYSATITGTNLAITNPSTLALNTIKGTYDTLTADNAAASSTTGVFNTTSGQTAWCAIDPLTGNNVFNLTNVPVGSISSGLLGNLASGGIQAQGPYGEWLVYGISRAGTTGPYTQLWQWNNTKVPGIEAAAGITAWGPGLRNYNMSTAYDWNVTLSQPLVQTDSPIGSGTPNAATGRITFNPQILYVFPGNLIFGQSSGLQTIPGTSAGIFGTPDPYTLWAINLNSSRGPIGQVLFQRQYAAPSGNKTIQIGPADGQNNVFTIYFRETMQWSGLNMLTGEPMWGPLEPQNSWNYYSGTTGLTNPIGVGYGHLYTAGYGGVLYAINTKTGKVDFTYGNDPLDPKNSTFTPSTVYGEYPTQVAAIANNKIYLVEEEHSLDSPAYHGAKTRCVDAFTGRELWEIYGICSWQSNAVADGYYTWLNYNDLQIYAMGPGPSATSVTVKNDVVPLGSSVLITGTVTDQSSQPQLTGTAAVSDADQEFQMEFLIQHSIDQPNLQGVPVTLTAIDSSGNKIAIGQRMSDGLSGTFKMLWTPPAVGEYTIVANFTGSQSYGPSYASTAIGVVAATPAPVVTPTAVPTPTAVSPIPTIAPSVAPTPTPTSATGPGGLEASQVYVIAAAVIVIVIVAVAAVALKRRK
jgi:hypothetical protein